MLTSKCINPEIMSALACCGHGSKILIADGNYPLSEKAGNAKKVYLSLSRDVPTVTQVLKVIKGVVNIEKATLMETDDGTEPQIHREFRTILGNSIPIEKLFRYDFYDACSGESGPVLVIGTGDTRRFGNILITIDCV